MALSPNIARPTTPTTDTPTGSTRLAKTDLVGELIAYAVLEYDPARDGMYGTSPFARVDLVVVTGPHAGTHDDDWHTHGNLARQLAESARDGITTSARVVSGPGRTLGQSWYGIDTASLTGDDVTAARRAVEATLRPAPADTDPGPLLAMMTSQGRANRRRGIRWEQQLARYLREHGYPHAECAPRGEQQHHGDIVGARLDLFIEAKNTREHRLGEWLDKARRLAGAHRSAVVIVKRRGHADPAESFVVLRLADWLDALDDTRPTP